LINYFLTFSINAFRKSNCMFRIYSDSLIGYFSLLQIRRMINYANFKLELSFCEFITELAIDYKISYITGLFRVKIVGGVFKIHEPGQRRMHNILILINWKGVIRIAEYCNFLFLKFLCKFWRLEHSHIKCVIRRGIFFIS
jgi:hypothetical protein